MKAKKIVRLILSLIFVMSMAFSVVGCESECEHKWENATCQTPKTCKLCGAYMGEKAPHVGGVATCTKLAECTACGEEYGELNAENHTGSVIWFMTNSVHYEGYSCCGLATSAEENHNMKDGQCTICSYNSSVKASTVQARAGDSSVIIDVTIADNPGIIGLEVTIEYNQDVLTLVDAVNGSVLEDLNFSKPTTMESGCKFIWDGIEATNLQEQNGKLLSLKFNVSTSAQLGNYPIILRVKAYDNNVQPFTLKVENGTVTIIE